eukprot:TRINITY_DN11787_c0_g1_i2.p1 TRINITY_DN11787_c0_g1~~TRINITY_DN11787_c0_g1_i2.p1  ORF type:complete len:498 (+),score=41.47 TRINITY_DN11787_c0_g1_i2:48-1541(+)
MDLLGGLGKSDCADSDRQEGLVGTSNSSPRSQSWCGAESRIHNSPILQEQRASRAAWSLRRCTSEQAQCATEQQPLRKSILYNTLSFGSTIISLFDESFQPEIGDELNEGEPTHSLHKLGSLEVFLATVKGNTGIGVLLMAHGWKNGGMVFSTATILLVAVLAIVSIFQFCAVRSHHDGTLGSLLEMATGRCGRICYSSSVALMSYSWLSAALITMASLMQQSVLPSVSQEKLIIAVSICLSPLVAIRNMKRLSPIVLLGTVSMFSGVIVVFGVLFCQASQAGLSLDGVAAFNPNGALVFLGTACFSFEGICILNPTYDACADRKTFPKVYASALSSVTLINIGVGVFGYLVFGQLTDSLILLNFQAGWVVRTLRLLFAGSVFCTAPPTMLSAFNVTDVLVFEPMSNPPLSRKIAKTIYRLSIVAFWTLVALCFSDSLDGLVSMIGAVCGIPLAFLYPAICHRRLMTDLSCWQKRLDEFIIAFGALLLVACVVGNLI